MRIFALLRRVLLYPSRVCLARRAFALLVPPLCTSRIGSARRAFALLVALLLCSSRVCFARPSALCVAHWLCASRIGSACRALAVRVAPLQCVSRFCSARRAFVLRGASRICVARVARLCCAPRFGLARLIAHLRLGLDNPAKSKAIDILGRLCSISCTRALGGRARASRPHNTTLRRRPSSPSRGGRHS